MIATVLCKICGKRRAKRACPAIGGDICSICCGTEREVSLRCPLECEYLQEAHRREKRLQVSDEELLFPDIAIKEDFLVEQEELLLFLAYALLQAALRTDGAVDADVLAALEAIAQTYRTLEGSGLVVELRARDAISGAVQRMTMASIEEYQKAYEERESMEFLRDRAILTMVVFLHRLGQRSQNGRVRGRMFIDLLRQMTPDNYRPREASAGIIV